MRRLIFLVPVVAFVFALLWACPPATECASQTDCPIPKVCNAKGACVPPAVLVDHDGGPVDGGFGGEGEGEGEGEGQLVTNPQTLAPVSMFQLDPQNPNKALVGEVDGNTDQVRSFNLATGAFDSGLAFDFKSQAVGCNADTITRFDASIVAAAALAPTTTSETWFTCKSPARTRAMYNVDFANLYDLTEVANAQIVLFLPGGGVGYTNDIEGTDTRAVVAARGGSSLTFVKLDGSIDQIDTARHTETLAPGTTFTHIEQIFVLRKDDAQYGDIILVFDRGATPRLVPLQRELNDITWHGAPLANGANPDLAPISLPNKTDAILFRGDPLDVDVQGLVTSDPQKDDANLVAFRPTETANGVHGLVTFLRYETELTSHNITPTTLLFDSGFTDLDLTAVSDPVAAPLATDRILLQEVPLGGNDTAFFYAQTQSSYAWRIPLHRTRNENRKDEVKRAQFVRQAADKPTNMILAPGNFDHAWFSFADPTTLELNFVPFLVNF